MTSVEAQVLGINFEEVKFFNENFRRQLLTNIYKTNSISKHLEMSRP